MTCDDIVNDNLALINEKNIKYSYFYCHTVITSQTAMVTDYR